MQFFHRRVEYTGSYIAVALITGAELEDLSQVVQRDDKAAPVAPRAHKPIQAHRVFIGESQGLSMRIMAITLLC